MVNLNVFNKATLGEDPDIDKAILWWENLSKKKKKTIIRHYNIAEYFSGDMISYSINIRSNITSLSYVNYVLKSIYLKEYGY